MFRKDSLLALFAALALVACRDSGESGPDAGAINDAHEDGPLGYPPPRDNLVPRVGSATTFDLAAWNIQLFPKTANTPAIVADLITSMDLDVVVVEEITSEAAWNELEQRLPEHLAVVSPHTYFDGTYQKLGVLYRKSLVKPQPMQLLFNGQTTPFPRPAIKMPITVDDGVHAQLVIELIGVHLKAGVTTEDRTRRTEAVTLLDSYVRTQIATGGEDEVVMLGDFNEVVTDATGQMVMAPLLDAASDYTVQTREFAQGGGITYLGFGGRAIDHLVTTSGLAAEVAGGQLVVPQLQNQLTGYSADVSDHLPVVLRVPLR